MREPFQRFDVPHFYDRIPGYFTFPDFYAWLARELPDYHAHFVEVGVYAGQSVAFLGVELLRLGKRTARIDLVDLFHGGAETVRAALQPIAPLVGTLYAGLSWEMARGFADKSLDAVFIDADHEYSSVAQDIDAWRPKIKDGGVLAGHDYTPHFPGLVQAVNERFATFIVWPGVTTGGDDAMKGKHWPVWSVRL